MLVFQCYFLFGSRVHEQFGQLRTQEIQLLADKQLQEQGGADRSQGAHGVAAIDVQLAQNKEARDAYRDLAVLLVPFSNDSAAPTTGVGPDDGVEVALAALKMILDFLAAYLLPALYGLLGACAFVLRQLSADLSRDVSELRSGHDSRYSLRLNIGVLAGLAVGWFVDPSQEGSVVANLSPLALAFVAGYGSDLMFAAMDRIVNAFAGETNERPVSVASERLDRQQIAGPGASERATTVSKVASTRHAGERGRRTSGNGAVNGAFRRPAPTPAS
jgi:hypothetical protein